MKKPKFQMVVSSDLDYEKMVIYIMEDHYHIATLNSDRNNEFPELQIHERLSSDIAWTLDCKEFLDVLNKSIERLKVLNSYVEA